MNSPWLWGFAASAKVARAVEFGGAGFPQFDPKYPAPPAFALLPGSGRRTSKLLRGERCTSCKDATCMRSANAGSLHTLSSPVQDQAQEQKQDSQPLLLAMAMAVNHLHTSHVGEHVEVLQVKTPMAKGLIQRLTMRSGDQLRD